MHELSIVSKAVNSIEAAAGKNNLKKITEVTLVVGKLRAAVPELLVQAFEELSPGTIFEGAKLVVEETDVDLECRSCGKHIGKDQSLLYGCPFCGSHGIKTLSGNELMIKNIKGI